MTRFAYKTLVFDTRSFWNGASLDHAAFTNHLNEAGEEGWELVNVFDLNRRHGESFEVVAVFKQPIG